MVESFYHPTIGFLLLALILPFLPGKNWWKWLLPLPAAAAIISVFTLDPGNYGTIDWFGFTLQVGRIDKLSLIFANVFAIQALIGFIYAFHLKEKSQHVAACLYVSGSFGVVFAGDYLTLFIFWELMSVGSVFLIWLNAKNNGRALGAGIRYFLFHTVGGLLILAGLLLRHKAVGNWDFIPVAQSAAHYYDWLIMFGFGVNAAFIVLHAWLPDAYPEATVTGAVFMSAFTTKTAVYTLARGFAGWDFLAYMGVGMALYGVFYATMENNARRILSYHIMSQVGYMVAGIGIGTAMTLNGACAHAYAHILYKGLLFMSVGALLYSCGTAKLNELGGLVGRLPWVMLAYVVAGMSISGWPLFNGFVSKTMTIAGAFEDHRALLGIGMELAAVGTFLSVGIKLPYFAFWSKPDAVQREIKPIPWNMYLAMGISSFLCILQGVYPEILYQFLPYEVEFHPFSAWQVLQAVLLLSFTGLAFYVMRRIMVPHEQRNVDFEWFYILFGRAFLFICRYPFAWLDSWWTERYRTWGLRGMLAVAAGSSWYDWTGIKGAVDGVAATTRRVGQGAAKLQTGRLQTYLAYAVLLAAGVMFAIWAVNQYL
ncbi:MAG: Na(+)/H(+) antiporter subunit D [Desulfovibrionaceae bacterium]